MSESSLAGKKALVTGGARGIGAAISRAFAAAGARTAIHYVRSDLAAQNLARRIRAARRIRVAPWWRNCRRSYRPI